MNLLREYRLWRAFRDVEKAKRMVRREAQRRLAADVERRKQLFETIDYIKRHNAALKDTGRKVI